jgi:hypothetical protein
METKKKLITFVDCVRDFNEIIITFKDNYPNIKTCFLWSSEKISLERISIIVPSANTDYTVIWGVDAEQFFEEWDHMGFVPGNDTGTVLACQLQHKYLGKDSNPLSVIDLMENKYTQSQFFVDCNINTISQGTDISQIPVNCFPAIIKRTVGNGSMGAYRVDTMQQIPSYDNDELFWQEIVEGVEYAVDFTSFRGQHKLVGVYRYTYRDNCLFRSKIELLDPHSNNNRQIVKGLLKFGRQCLDAMNWQHGATHNEIIARPDGLFHLVEVNFRKSGHRSNKGYKLATGIGLCDLVLAPYTTDVSLFKDLDTYSFKQPMLMYFLNLSSNKYIPKPDLEPLTDLKSFCNLYDHTMSYNFSKELKETTDGYSNLGQITFSNDDITQLSKDCAFYKEWSITNLKEHPEL